MEVSGQLHVPAAYPEGNAPVTHRTRGSVGLRTCLEAVANKISHVVSFKSFTAVMFQVDVFWVVTPSSVVVGYLCFGGLCCLHLQGDEVEDGGNMDL
jgi:hypothetical protein